MNDFVIENGILNKYTGKGGNVVIPEGVTVIGDGAFMFCKTLTSATIPEGVTRIGRGAFYGCESLQNVAIPAGVTKIGGRAFKGCSSLLSVMIPASVTTIGYEVFSGCWSLTSVMIPEGVTEIGESAFAYCNSLTSVVIPAGVTHINAFAFHKCGSLTSITIPDSVTSIGAYAFSDCSSLRSVTIPEGVTGIGGRAFEGCSSLLSMTIPKSVIEIEYENAFGGCKSLTEILVGEDSGTFTSKDGVLFTKDGKTLVKFPKGKSGPYTIPEGVTEISAKAFADCRSLTSVTIPESVTSIGDEAFYRCRSLTSVVIPASVTSIGSRAFADDWNGTEKRTFQVHFADSHVTLGSSVFVSNNARFSAIDLAGIILFQPAKTRSDLICWETIDAENANLVASHMVELLEAPAKETRAATQAAGFFLEHLSDIEPETLRALAAVLEEKKYKTALGKLRSDPAAGGLLGGQEAEDDPIDELVRKNWVVNDTVKALQRVIKSGIPYADSEKVSTPQAVIYAIAACEEATDRLGSYFVFGGYEDMLAGDQDWMDLLESCFRQPFFDPAVDQVAGALDRKALLDLLEQQVYEKSNGRCLAALARYGGEEQAERLVAELRSWNQNARRVMLLSDTKAAVIYAEKQGWMDTYAKMRGTDAETIWIKVMVDFGLDKDGKKVYDLGGRTVTVTLGEDMKFLLFDETAGKTVRTLPKKNADPDKLAAAGKDLTEMRKNIKKVVTTQGDALLRHFLSGEGQSADKWKELYLQNPVLRYLARLVVWNQGKDTFVLGPDGVIRSGGSAYTVTDAPVGVAHPMEMAPAEVTAWQNYFVTNGLKQPFEQVWEPVVAAASILPERYKGCKLPEKVFYRKEKHGIKYSPSHDFGYTATDAELRLSGCELSWEYDEADDEIVLGAFSFRKYTRQVNHIVALLDRWTVAGRILKDDVTVREQLDGFTAAQIMEYIRLASENSCPSCAAMLLEYKQAHYPDFDPMAEFTLE